jgi:hypothetical protein
MQVDSIIKKQQPETNNSSKNNKHGNTKQIICKKNHDKQKY